MIRPETLPMVRTLSMNDTHFETMVLINRLADTIEYGNVDAITPLLNRFHTHTTEHFSDEEKMMLEKGFPPYLAHKEEHDQALAELNDSMARFESTHDLGILKEYLESNLIPWFLRHTETMDAVTSMFLENSEVHLEFWKKLKPRN